MLLGDSGTGKSHLLIGLGLAACEQGRRVRYATAAQLVNELAEAADERRLSRIVARYGRLDLLCLDELGYVQLDARGSRTAVPDPHRTRRESLRRRRLATCPSANGATIIPDPRLVAAIVDRLTFNAHIIETGTDSYRLRTTTHPTADARAPEPVGTPAPSTHPDLPEALTRPYSSRRFAAITPITPGGAKSGEHGGASLG